MSDSTHQSRIRRIGCQIRGLAGRARTWLAGGSKTWVPTDEEIEFLRNAAASAGPGVRVRPRTDDLEIMDGRAVLPAFHVVQTDLLKRNQSPVHAFELWSVDGAVECRFVPGTSHMVDRMEGQLSSRYRDADVTRDQAGFPLLKPGQHIAAVSLSLRRREFYPIRRHDVEDFETDPLEPLITTLLGTDSDDMESLVQVVFKPAKGTWPEGGWFGPTVDDAAAYLRTADVKGWLRTYEVEPSKTERRAAELVQSQRGSDAFHTELRILVSGKSAFTAVNRVWEIARVFEQYFDSMIGQGFQPTLHRGPEIEYLVGSAVDRQLTGSDLLLTVDELAGLAHVPAASLTTPPLDWTDITPHDRLPAEAESFNENREQA